MYHWNHSIGSHRFDIEIVKKHQKEKRVIIQVKRYGVYFRLNNEWRLIPNTIGLNYSETLYELKKIGHQSNYSLSGTKRKD